MLAILAMASCSTNYSITGSSDISLIDGDKIYLAVESNGDRKNLDSCNVVHGKFQFSSSVDSTMIAYVITENPAFPPFPIVLEQGDIVVVLNNMEQVRKGTELNDTLNAFNAKLNKYEMDLAKIEDKLNKAISNIYTGENDYTDVQKDEEKSKAEMLAGKEQMELLQKVDDYYTKFVKANFNNVLAPFVFIRKVLNDTGGVCILTPWAEALLVNAPESFKRNADISEFISIAEKNKKIANGTETPDVAPIDGSANNIDATMTPSQMAAESGAKNN